MSRTTLELKDTVVRAGAGAGKTTGLVDKVVEVYRRFKKSGDGPRIVLTTFTRKSTQELKERLILRAVKEKDAELLQFVSDPTRLHISTIHGLLNLFLKQVGHLAGMDSGFQIVDETEGEHLARLALREALVNHPAAMQWLEVYGFQRILSMCRSFQALRREQGELQSASIEDIEAAAFLRLKFWQNGFFDLFAEIESSGDEALQRFAEVLRPIVDGWAKTFPDLENFPDKPRRSPKQVEFEDIHERTKKFLGRFKEEMKKPTWQRELWPQMVSSWSEFLSFAEDFTVRFQQLKDGQARFEMNDLELKSLEVLRADPLLGKIFAESWDFWMIDEYQDTSPLQVKILETIIGDKPKYLVGDPQQSIYLFRGAEVGVFDEAEKAIADRGEALSLMTNFRSKPSLLLWINDFIVTLGDSFRPMLPREQKPEADDVSVTLFRAADPDLEAKGLVAQIQKKIQAGSRLEEICVISRTHRGLMEISRVLKEFGFPTHVHAARGFSSRREVMDAKALWKFLANPHDNLNLLTLLRSPWYFVEDWRLEEWMTDRPNSLWRKLAHISNVPEAVARLKGCLEQLRGDGMVRTFEKALIDCAMLDLSLNNDPAGRKESNLWKLIHKAQALEKEGGRSLLDLMQSAAEDPLDASEGDATTAQEPNCINLMTIHGSKGLQFDHVIVPRMAEMPVASNTPPLFAENGIYFFPVWNEELGEFVASPLDFFCIQRRREKEMREYDRWLYVALTRAKVSLTLSWTADGRDSQSSRTSWTQRSPWFDKPKGVHRSPNYTVEVVEEMPAPSRYLSENSASRLVREPYAAAEQKAIERVSVTELGQREIQIKSVDLLKRWQAQAAGTRIHRALEALKYGNDAGKFSDENVRYALELREPPLREWIQNGHAEWGFQVQTRGKVVEGQIDLWVETEAQIYVVDYKTGSDAQKEMAFAQLSRYAWALRKFGHTKPITMVVIYPVLKKTESRSFTDELFLAWETELGGT